ncbi:MAG: ferric reductase-like transmembrane domain-containing protein [Candidatus Doudnabacteria bacterium]|nr:ferric reductase-like transmembrane domain-containing protein [Candidatus Doudnabacteria bacterium]
MNVNRRKKLLLLAIIGSMGPLVPALDFTKFNLSVDLLALAARSMALSGSVLLMWEYILTARALVVKIVPDTAWVQRIHRRIGHLAVYLIGGHFIFITIFYAQSRGINLLNFLFNRPEQFYKNMGILSLLLIVVLVITSITLRSKLSFRSWHKLHLTSYLVLPLALIHNLGLAREDVPISANWYWYLMTFIYVCFLVYMYLFSRGKLKQRYEIQLVDKEAVKVVNIHLLPESSRDRFAVHPGQYIYVQRQGSLESHPFSISKFDHSTGLISIAPKALGPFSGAIQHMQAGEVVYVDGPYGNFTEEIYTSRRPVVLLAGGIGIVPFLPTLYRLAEGMNREIILFYGNNTEAEIAFNDELAEIRSKAPSLKVVYVIRDNQNSMYETGFITLEILQKYLGNDVAKYEFFVCGPPVMMSNLQKALAAAQVPQNQIHTEAFSA